MRVDNLDQALSEALHQEVQEEAYCIDRLEERIVSEIEGRMPRKGISDFLRRMIAPTRAGRIGQLATVGLTAAVFLVFGIFLAGKITSFDSEGMVPAVATGANGQNQVLFVMPAPGADRVSVVGNFNGWEAMPLADDNGDGIWTASILLPDGRYEYAFVVDGRWWGQDPLADGYVHSFGEYNSVRYVGQVGEGA
jgi:hypothetical protein